MMRGHLLAAALVISLPCVARAETKASDPKAVAIADQVMAGLGGKQRWDALVGLRWTFGASVNDTVKTTRRHSWNKQTGWHRVEGKTRAGQEFCYIHQLGSDQGMAWVDGTAIEGDSLQKLLKRANSICEPGSQATSR